MSDITAIIEERNKVHQTIKDMADLLEKEKRDFTDEEQLKFDKACDEFDDLTDKLKAEKEDQEKATRKMAVMKLASIIFLFIILGAMAFVAYQLFTIE